MLWGTEKKILSKVIKPTLRGLYDKGIKYKGFLYAGLMIVNNEPMVVGNPIGGNDNEDLFGNYDSTWTDRAFRVMGPGTGIFMTGSPLGQAGPF